MIEGSSHLQDSFRNVMARVATAISVITSMTDGAPHGTTVSAFASLSMRPPMVMVSLDRGSELLSVIRESGRFGVNILGATHADWARAFAGKGGQAKFHGISWNCDSGVPRLPGTCWLACELASQVASGDHVIALGNVVTAEPADCDPLTYHDRAFGTHTAFEEA
jgi:flavin reductase (DIM6/NTAB) family NADH-FMN oxidoreductase RutF